MTALDEFQTDMVGSESAVACMISPDDRSLFDSLVESGIVRLQTFTSQAADFGRFCCDRMNSGNDERAGVLWVHFTDDAEAGGEALSDPAVGATEAAAAGHSVIVASVGPNPVAALSTESVPDTAEKAAESIRFEFGFPEQRVRVPVYLLNCAGDFGDRFALRGSFDVGRAILHWADAGHGRQDSETAEMEPLSILGDPDAVSGERKILIRGDGFSAIRDEDFLFVSDRTAASGTATDSPESAERLYSKPDDIWNVHDVSRVYPMQVDEYRRLIAAADRNGD